MAKKTAEQILTEINTLMDRLPKYEERYIRACAKIDKELVKELKKVPYTQYNRFLDCMETIDESRARETAARYKAFEVSIRDGDIKDTQHKIDTLKKTYAERLAEEALKEKKDALYKEMSTPNPALIGCFKNIIREWKFSENELEEEKRYYSKLSQEELDNIAISMAKEVTFRCYPLIGKIDTFTVPFFSLGVANITCTNAQGKSCSISSTWVEYHTRTSAYGKTYDVRGHVRVIVK